VHCRVQATCWPNGESMLSELKVVPDGERVAFEGTASVHACVVCVPWQWRYNGSGCFRARPAASRWQDGGSVCFGALAAAFGRFVELNTSVSLGVLNTSARQGCRQLCKPWASLRKSCASLLQPGARGGLCCWAPELASAVVRSTKRGKGGPSSCAECWRWITMWMITADSVVTI